MRLALLQIAWLLAILAIATTAFAQTANDPWRAQGDAAPSAPANNPTTTRQAVTRTTVPRTAQRRATPVRQAAHEEPAAPAAPAPAARPPAPEASPRPDAPAAIPLARRGDTSTTKPGRSRSSQQPGSLPIVTVAASLAMVLGLFFLLAVFLRRGLPKSMTPLPAEVLETLGRAPLSARQHAHLVRCGNKLLLLAVSQLGVETLTEITDPGEVDRLSGLCRQSHPHSSAAAFRSVLTQLSRESDGDGFVGRASSLVDLANERAPATAVKSR
ncbi:MAG: flagellar biosynthetic protein FliO [Pirellulales bacterium]|nr:flagellar biosynthetic protein FliO [Pirellulales bacterium]